MSLILDALNKSDSERNQNNAPSINSNHDVDVNGGRVNGNHKLVILASIAATLLAIAIILFVVLSPSDTPSSAALNATQTSSQSAQAAALDRGEQSDTNDLKPRKIDKLKERAIAAHYQQAQINEQESKAPKNIDGAAASALGDNKESDQKVLAIYQQEKKPTVQAAPKPRPTMVATAKPAPTSRPTPAPRITPPPSSTLAKYPLLSFISDLPYSMQKTIPTIMYTRHKYRPEGNSFVRFNNVEFRQGQKVAEKVYLEEILHDGVILRYGSRKLKMKALNSWVNM